MKRIRIYIPFLLACLALLVAAPAGARPVAGVTIVHPVVGHSANGFASILVPVRYPIELKGRLSELRLALIDAGGKKIRSWVLHERLNGGSRWRPAGRRRFTFVHRLGLTAELSRQLRQGASVRVLASGRLDVEGDGKAEMDSRDLRTDRPRTGPRRTPVCSSIPLLRMKPGARLSVPLPVCDTERTWTVHRVGTGAGSARHGRLTYTAPKRFRGSVQVELTSRGVRRYARVIVGAGANPRVRAIGDSVTAGFGYFGTGGWMGPVQFARQCRPAKTNFNDACSSNSESKVSEEGAVEYVPDYGLARNVSWVAQWANENGVTDFQNLAVSGSEPRNWAPGGIFYREKTLEMEREDPDFVLLTLGANPMLSNMLLEPSEWWCALVEGMEGFEKCIREEFAHVELQTNLKRLYADLLSKTSATIYVMQYHLSIPVSAVFERTTEIARANQMLNEEIASIVAAASNPRLKLVEPPHFNVGIDVRPVFPAGTQCPPADGPSVQSEITQDDLELWHPLTYCEGPEIETEDDWVISSDSGIHPSVTGYAHMASVLPAP